MRAPSLLSVGAIRAVTLAAALFVALPAAAQRSGREGQPQPDYVAPPAIVLGRILGPDKKGLAEAEVLMGSTARTFTDRNGRFEFDSVGAGEHEMMVRKVGFAPVRFRVKVANGDVWDGTVHLQLVAQSLPDVIVLDSVPVLKNFRPKWIDGFIQRRRMGAGTFLDRVDIENAHALRTAHLVQQAPGVTSRQGFGYDELNVNRCHTGAGSSSKGIIFVDGYKTEESFTGRFATLADYSPERLSAVEIYKGHNTIPPQFDDPQACFVVLLWTTRR